MRKRTPARTVMSPPVHLTEPTFPPRPVDGCDVCGALAKQRAAATAAGDYSRATDCSVEMRKHRHAGGPR
ncbi:hypothetical protein PV318_03350 [Streptomyces sp. ME02-6991-2B]|nr:hypothetical protein [Streptomyces sp. ME02-6991-2B]